MKTNGRAKKSHRENNEKMKKKRCYDKYHEYKVFEKLIKTIKMENKNGSGSLAVL